MITATISNTTQDAEVVATGQGETLMTALCNAQATILSTAPYRDGVGKEIHFSENDKPMMTAFGDDLHEALDEARARIRIDYFWENAGQ